MECKKIFGNLPEKHRPKCDKVEDGSCPKGVPVLSPENHDTWLIYQILLTQSVDIDSGLLRYDAELISALCDLLEVEGRETVRLSGKLLFMIDASNALRLEKLKKQRMQDKKAMGAEATMRRLHRAKRELDSRRTGRR